MIGHLLGAAGAVEFIVCVKSVLEGYVHATAGLTGGTTGGTSAACCWKTGWDANGVNPICDGIPIWDGIPGIGGTVDVFPATGRARLSESLRQ